MSQLTGNEFQNEKGTQGGLMKFVWGKIYMYFNAIGTQITDALANYYTKTEVDGKVAQEVTDREAAIATLQGTLQTAIDAKTTTSEVATQIQTAITALVDGAPTALNTLNELATALAANETGDDATLAALNVLITTVDDKASKVKVNELAALVKENFVTVLDWIKQAVGQPFTYFLANFTKNGIVLTKSVGSVIPTVTSVVDLSKGLQLRFGVGGGDITSFDTATLETNLGVEDADKTNYDVLVALDTQPWGTSLKIMFNPAIYTTDDLKYIVVQGVNNNVLDAASNNHGTALKWLNYSQQTFGLGGYTAG